MKNKKSNLKKQTTSDQKKRENEETQSNLVTFNETENYL